MYFFNDIVSTERTNVLGHHFVHVMSWEWYDTYEYNTAVGESYIYISTEPISDGVHIPELSITSGGIGDACFASTYSSATGFFAGPINTRTGGYDYTVTDLSLSTSAGELSFQREYASLSIDNPSPISPGWTHNHDTRLILPTDPEGQPDTVLFKAHTANKYVFTINGDGTYSPYPGLCATLISDQGSYILKDAGQKTYTFDSSGKLLTYADAQGNAWSYTYLANGKLDRVSADGGSKYLDLDYDAQGRVLSVRDQTDRSVTYHYDANGDLDSVEDVLNQNWTYEYHPTLIHLLTRVAAPGNVTIERTEYYPDGRAWKQYDGEDNLLVELVFHADGTTTIKDSLDDVNPVTHTYDGRGTLTTEENADGGQQQKQYDFNFRPVLITDPLGNPTTMSWSSNGTNLEYIKDAMLGETFIQYENPNGPNSPTSIIDPEGYETKYFYNDSNFPTLPTRIEYPLSFTGGTTWVGTDYEYYPPSSGAATGKVKFVTDALGNQTYYTYNSSGQTETVTTAYGTPDALTTTYTYDTLGRLEDLTDELGIVTHNEYDDAGRLTKTIHNVHPFVTIQNYLDKYNITTKYFYDSRGNQIAVIDTYGTLTRTYFDLANRSVTNVQNLVVSGTEDDINTPIGDIPIYDSNFPDRNIRSDTEYDNAGNVIITRDPAGIITRTYYDEANRPKLVIQNWAGTNLYGDITTAPLYISTSPDQNVRTEYFYDVNGNVIATKDTLAVITRTYYDELNRPKTVVQNLVGQDINVATSPSRGSSSNIRTDTYYDLNGNVIATVDPRGVITRTYYDALNRPITVVQNLAGQAISVTTPPAAGTSDTNIRTDTYYDQAGNVIASIEPRGVVTRTYYDSANRPYVTVQNLKGQNIYVTTPPARGSGQSDENIRTDIAYDSFGRRDTTTDSLGRVTKYQYDEVGQLTGVIANYVNGGLPQNDLNQRNIVTQYAYDALGRQVQTTDTLGRVSASTYDVLGRVSTSTQNYDPSYSQNYKDAQGNQYNLVMTSTYDVRGNQIAIIDTTGVVTRTYYDALARPVAVVRNLVGQDISNPFPPVRANPPSSTANIRTDTVYLGNGNVDYVLDEMGQKTDYEYDAPGRLITVQDPLLHAISYEYDANGNRTLMTDAEGVSTKYEYDGLNRLKAVIENYRAAMTPDVETNVRTEYTYDASGNRLSIRDGNSNLEGVDYRTIFTYDAFGHQKTETDPLGNVNAYYYDAVGNRYRLLDANGKATLFSYDEMNRLELINYPSPDADVAFSYDALGRRLSMTDGIGTTTWTYTNLDQPNLITDPFGTGVSYDYDALGNRTQLSYGSQSYNYQFNNLNQLDQVTGSGLPTPLAYQYDSAGRLKSITRPNGVNTAYDYFDNGWLQDIVHSSGSETPASYQYQYDADGNRNQVVENIFQPENVYTLTVNISGNGSVTRSSEGPYHPNDVVTLTATADPGWTFTGWNECAGTEPCSVTMNGNKTVTATFVQTEYTLTLNVTGSGVVTRDNNGPYHLNDVVTLTAVADPGWSFAGWSECPGTGSCIVTMTGNKTVTATFVRDQYTLTINVAGNGTVTRDNNGPYHLNDVVMLTAVPDSNWTFAYWSDGVSGTANPITVTITGNLTVTANFDAAPVDTGWISPAANGAVTSGSGDNNGFQTNPANAYSDDTAFAVDTNSGTNTNTSCSNSGKDRHVFYNYDLASIPSGSTILGIEVRLDMKVDSTSGAPKSCLELSWDGGATWTAAKTSNTFTTTAATYVLGGADDTWGRIWTTGELSNLRVRITNVASNTSRDFSLDWIPVRVSYIPSSLPAGMIFTDGFESGDFSRWDWVDGDGNLTVSAQAAAVGSYGMKAVVNDAANLMVFDGSPINQKHYSARFYFNPNSINIPNGQGLNLFAGSDNTTWVFCVYLRHVGGSYLLNLCGEDDSGSWLDESDGVYINNAWTAVEVEWQAASAPGANNGFLNLWVNDTVVETIQNIDNDTQFIKDVDLGVYSTTAGTSGAMYFDAFESRTGGHIGLDPNGPVLAPLPLPPDTIFADGFESVNLSAWYWTDTNGGNLSVSPQSAAVGSYGVQALITDSGAMALTEGQPLNVLDVSDPFYFNPDSVSTPRGLENLLNSANDMVMYDNMPDHEKHYNARFYFDPNSVDLPNGQGMYLFSGSDEHWVICLYVERQGTYYRLILCGEDDALNWIENRSVYITDAWQAIEIEWQAATVPGANNGYLRLFVNDVLVDNIQNLDTDARSITSVDFGVGGIPAGTTGTIYFDAFESRRVSHIGLDPNGPPTQPPLSGLVFLDGFESGDLSSWASAITGGGDLSVTTGAAMFGSFGMQAVINDTVQLYVEDWSPQQETQYNVRFYFDPHSVAIPSGQSFNILANDNLRLRLKNNSGTYQLRADIYTDSGTWTNGSFLDIANSRQLLEVEWKTASAPGANDGHLMFWINDLLADTLANVDNDTRVVNDISLGAVSSIPAGTSGTIYFDSFESRRTGYIGPFAYQAPVLAQEMSASQPNGSFQLVSYKIPSLNLVPLQQGNPVTIDYVYDPLKRLKEANYSNGDYYHYTYDAVGNRLSQETSIGGLVSTTNYVYDDANRLTSVNGVTYTWDNNGNLLSDGVNTHAYDSANRLKTFTDATTTASYTYNGLGDRLRETVNGVTTTFTMDLNTPLTQALSDGTNTYIYGNGRIAQVNAGTEYFLGDALGSVRQLTDASGAITYARAFDPYGVVTTTAGTAQTSYGYTGEYSDTYIKLIYLRSRWYDPASGRFTTRDSWQGDYNKPLSLNHWMYVEGNPVNRTDPSGKCWYPDLQNGGTNIDFLDPSSGICPWFVDAFQANGVTIPLDTTPDNWVNNLPPHLRSLILIHAGCVGNQNQTFLTPGPDLWMVIRFYTRPKWEYYQATSTTADFELTLGIGGGGSLSCDNNTQGCTLSGGVDLGGGGSVLGFKLKYSLGIGSEWDIDTGSVRVGGTANAGPCDLFVGFTKISIGCTAPITLQTIEVGWIRDALPEEYWVLAKSSTFSSLSYEDFAALYLPFDGNSRIYHRVEDTNRSYLALWLEHYNNNRVYVFK